MKKTQSKRKRKSSGGQVSDEEITDLQKNLLEAVLLGKPLPGSQKPVQFPDISFFLSQPTVKLVTENLAGSISINAPSKPVDLVSRKSLMQEARSGEEVAYLYFYPPVVGKNDVMLTLAGKIIPKDSNKGELGLSSVSVKFRKVNGEWRAVDDPLYSAA